MSEFLPDVLDLLQRRFPVPDESRFAEGDTEELLSQLRANFAVNGGHLHDRAEMAWCVSEKLRDGANLTISERAWLLYILMKLGPDNLPHEHQGRTPVSVMDRFAGMCSLGSAMLREANSNPKSSVTDRLRKSASLLGKSYESVRAMYYSSAYKSASEYPLFQKICREKAGID